MKNVPQRLKRERLRRRRAREADSDRRRAKANEHRDQPFPNPRGLRARAIWGALLGRLDQRYFDALTHGQLGEYEIARMNRRIALEASRAPQTPNTEDAS